MKVRNVSGVDRDLVIDGQFVPVPVGAEIELPAKTARALLAQTDVWAAAQKES